MPSLLAWLGCSWYTNISTGGDLAELVLLAQLSQIAKNSIALD